MSQSTISRVVTALTPLLRTVLEQCVPVAEDLGPPLVVGRTPELYSG